MNSFIKKAFSVLLIGCLLVLGLGIVRVNATENTVKWTASSGALGSKIGSGTISTGSYEWDYERTLISGDSYTGWTSNCIQLGKNGGVENITFTTNNIPGTIKSVSVECSSYQGKHNVSIAVGGVTYLAKTATSSWTTVSSKGGTGTSSGEIVISFTDGSRALYVKSISVVYDVVTTEPEVTIDTNDTDYKIGQSNVVFSASKQNTENAITWSSSDTDVVEVNSSTGAATFKAMGDATITASIDADNVEDTFDIKVWPDNTNPITIGEALEIAEFSGTTNSAFKYTTRGEVTEILTAYDSEHDNITIELSDSNDSIQAYRLSGGSDLEIGNIIFVNGYLKKYNTTLEFVTSTFTYETFTVTFESNGGSSVESQTIKTNKKAEKPSPDPTKAGFDFDDWYSEPELENVFDFNTPITANTILSAKWTQAAGNILSALNGLSIKSSLAINYTKSFTGSKTEFELFNGNLVEGDYLIVYDGKAMNTTVTNNRLQYEEVEINNDKITTGEQSIIWHIAPSGDYWTIYNASEDKYAASGTKNQAQMLDDGSDDKSLWTVSGSETYEFVNKANEAKSVNANLRNNGTYGFACYATGTGGALSLYKCTYSSQYSIDELDGNSERMDLKLNLGTIFTKDFYDTAVNDNATLTWGVTYILEEELNGLSSSLSELLEVYTIDEAIDAGLNLRNVACPSPARVNENGIADANGDYIQFGVSINGVKFANVAKKYCVVCYAFDGENYYFTEETKISVNDAAAKYVEPGKDTSSYSDYVDMLTWLSTYNGN